MLEIAISLIVGFALGYGVREWAFRQNRSQQRRRRPFWLSGSSFWTAIAWWPSLSATNFRVGQTKQGEGWLP